MADETPSPNTPSSSSSSSSPDASSPEPAMPSAEDISFEMPAGGASADPAAGASSADQAAIDELLKQAQFDDPSAAAGEAAGGAADPFSDIEALMKQAEAESTASGGTTPDTQPFDMPNFQQVMQDAQVSSIDLLRDVELNVKIELGRSRMLVEDVLKLGEGSVVELDKLAGDPVDVFVNERLVARGEVLVLNDNFCVRVNEIVAGLKEEVA